MAVDFVSLRGDLRFQADYTEPTFGLWQSPDQLFRLLFAGLSKYGLQLSDLKWGPSSGIGDAQLNFFLFNYGATVRIRIDRAEIEAVDLFKVDEQQLQEAATSLVKALQAHVPTLSFAAFVVVIAYHGTLSTGTAKDFNGRLTAPTPDALGPSTGAGTVIYYGPSEDRASSAVTLDLSAVVPDGLFVRVHTVWDASRVKIEDLATRARQYGERVFAGFGLNPVTRK